MNTQAKLGLARQALSAIAALTLSAGAIELAAAQQSTGAPSARHASALVMSGGIGLEARAELARHEREANLKLVFTEPQGSYLSGVDVKVLDSRGAVVVDTSSDGPWLLARLEPGSYRIIASDGGARREQVVDVGSGLRTVHIRLPDQGGITGRPSS
jgi:hypothetical protein